MTDITKLAQSLKAAAIDAKELAIIARYSKGRAAAEKFYALANPNNVLALVEALEKAQATEAHCNRGWIEAHEQEARAEAAEQRIAELESFRTAYMEWSDKTDWVNTDRRFGVVKPLGKHRADVLKAYIEHLESRTVTVKMPKLKMLEDYLAEVAVEERKAILLGVRMELHRALNAEGIKWEAE